MVAGSDKDGWAKLRKAIEASSKPWKKQVFFNPQSNHPVWIFTLNQNARFKRINGAVYGEGENSLDD